MRGLVLLRRHCHTLASQVASRPVARVDSNGDQRLVHPDGAATAEPTGIYQEFRSQP
jgi:hypothetical protein